MEVEEWRRKGRQRDKGEMYKVWKKRYSSR